jgi:wyosine [tRNA(Phe)-imidazoG37] synthetase (radical SAM superfamily)
MESEIEKITFGPVPSRRLGRSLGINNIPPKICPYSCIYCQVGRTLNMQVDRHEFYKPEKIFQDVEENVHVSKHRGEGIDYLTFVPNGEPTLDIHLGREITLLKKLGIKIAVITNSSLLWREDIRNELAMADWVSLKIDSLSRNVWRRINRPYGSLRLDQILNGISEFTRSFQGELTTETMLVQSVNDREEEIEKIAMFIAKIKPQKSFIAIPTRPPAERWAKPPEEYFINMTYQVFREKSLTTEYLVGYEGNAFASTGNVEEDLLSITSVHPMREEAVREFLKKAKADWSVIDNLIHENKFIEVSHKDKKFYLRKIGEWKRKGRIP